MTRSCSASASTTALHLRFEQKEVRMFLYDVHVHTSEASKCAPQSAAEMVEEYHAKGYRGIIVTDHFLNGNTRVPADLPWKERVFSSFFTAVTPRTAGFNVLPLSGAGSVKSVTLLLTIILMFIGGSSGSTAGGVKTNTIAVLGLSVISLVRGKRSVECFGRRIDETNVKNAAQFLTIFLTLIVVGAVLLCLFEQGNSLWPDDPEITGITVTESVFEVVSALATVGLTTGVTPQLTLGSQIVLCVLMFLGRAGCMTVMLSWKTPSAPAAELPMEKVRIG